MSAPRPLSVILAQLFGIVFVLLAYLFGPAIYYFSQMEAIKKERQEHSQLITKIAQQAIAQPNANGGQLESFREKIVVQPDAVKNLVLIRNEQLPDQMIQGYYFQQQNGRAYFVGLPHHHRAFSRGRSIRKLSALFDHDTPVEIIFHPLKPDEHIIPARYLAHGDKAVYFETQEPLPPPVKVDWRQSDYKRIEFANIYGYLWRESPAGEVEPRFFGVEVPAKTGAKLSLRGGANEAIVLERSKFYPSGTLICDELDVPFGLLVHDNKSSVFHFSELEQEAGLPIVTATLGLSHFNVNRNIFQPWVSYRDPLQLIDRVEYLIGTLNHLKPNLDLTTRRHLDQPVADKMQVMQLAPVESEEKHLQIWTGIFPGPANNEPPIHYVVQAHVTLKDGTDYYTFPEVDQFSEPALVKRESNELTPYIPVVDETEVPLQKNRTGTLMLPDLTPGVGKIDVADVVLDDVAWSADGQYVYLLTQWGRLHMIRIADQTQVRSTDLFHKCVDLDYSQSGLVVLGQGMLQVFDPESLQLKHTVAIPNARFVGTGTESAVTYVATSDSLWWVNLETGEKNEATILKQEDVPLPEGHFTGLEMTEDGQTVMLADTSRLHRCQPKPDGSLQHAESSLPLGQGLRMKFQQGDRRVALIIPRGDKTGLRHCGQSLSNASVRNSSITHNNLVFDVNDLSAPLAAISDSTLFIPLSGGMLEFHGNSPQVRLLRSNGEEAYNHHSNYGGQGAADPHSGRILFLEFNKRQYEKQIWFYMTPNGFTAPGKLIEPQLPQIKVEVESVTEQLPQETRKVGCWDVSRLDLKLERDVALEKQNPAGSEGKYLLHAFDLVSSDEGIFRFPVDNFDQLEAKYKTRATQGINVLIQSSRQAYSFDAEEGFQQYHPDGTIKETTTGFPVEQDQMIYGTRSDGFLLSGSELYLLSRSLP